MTGIFFTARLGSSRLPQKHLQMAGGKTFIEWLVLRYKLCFRKEITSGDVKLVIATSDEAENRKFLDVMKPHGVDVFFGNISNIPQRHLDCADHYKVDVILSIDGDDILCSTEGSKVVYDAFRFNPTKDIVACTGLPLGMNSSGYRVSYLRKSVAEVTDKKMETGWGRVFKDPKKLEIPVGGYDIYDRLRFTLDYPDDSIFFAKVIEFLGDKVFTISDEELIAVVKEQGFDKVNDHLFEIYWDNFNKLKAEETGNGK
jgi:spore coat polysaccharide biosynthesis protein SpsF (cytidylyltransferase family)